MTRFLDHLRFELDFPNDFIEVVKLLPDGFGDQSMVKCLASVFIYIFGSEVGDIVLDFNDSTICAGDLGGEDGVILFRELASGVGD